MTQRLRPITTAAMLVLIPSAAGLALAQSDKTDVEKGAVVPTTVQTAPIVKTGPISRPGTWGGALAPQGVISVFLTKEECEGLGGTVDSVAVTKCASGKACVTAGKDGVIRAACITKS